MDFIGILALIAFGIFLIVIEIWFIPGGIVGIIGVVCMGIAIFLSFRNYGEAQGFITLLVSGLILVAAIIYGFKTRLWDKISLNTAIESRAFEETDTLVKIGDEGVAVSALRPIGKGEFNDQVYEIRSFGEYVNPGVKVKIVMIKENKIFVEPIKNT
jgi:membrane-bound ClpP family serine protease